MEMACALSVEINNFYNWYVLYVCKRKLFSQMTYTLLIEKKYFIQMVRSSRVVDVNYMRFMPVRRNNCLFHAV